MLKKLNQLLPGVSLVTAVVVLLTSGLSVVAAKYMQPSHDYMQGMPNLETLIPKQFGDWHEVVDASTQVSVSPYHKNLMATLYDEVLTRSYEDNDGHRVMLAMAYAHQQKQEIKMHRPEVCYPAQGFSVLEVQSATFTLPDIKEKVLGKTLVTTDGSRYETVSYWIRMGNQYPQGGLQARYEVLKNGLQGTVIDGVLVRASIASTDLNAKKQQFDLQEKFFASMIGALKDTDKKWLISAGH